MEISRAEGIIATKEIVKASWGKWLLSGALKDKYDPQIKETEC